MHASAFTCTDYGVQGSERVLSVVHLVAVVKRTRLLSLDTKIREENTKEAAEHERF